MTISRYIITFLCLFITACSNVQHVSVEQLNGEIPENTGIVIAETLNNSTRITGPIERWTEIILWKEIPEGETDQVDKKGNTFAQNEEANRVANTYTNNTFVLNALNNSISTQSYMGAVPVGKYRIGLLYSFLNISDTTYHAKVPVFKAMGTFEVKLGQVTNLGTIIYQPFQDKTRKDNKYPDYALTRIDNPDLWNFIQETKPAISSQINTNLPVLGWTQDNYDQLRKKSAKLIRDSALPTKLHALTDGGYVLTGFFGGVYYNENNAWHSYGTGSHYKILDFAELPDKRWLLAGEFGYLALINPSTNKTEKIKVSSEIEHLEHIVMSDNGQVYVISNRDADYQVFKLNLETKKTTQIKSIKKQFNGFWNTGISLPSVIGLKNGISIFIDNIVYSYDEQQDNWEQKNAAEYLYVRQQQDGYIIGLPYNSFSGVQPIQYSADRGQTWVDINEKTGLLSQASAAPIYRFKNGDIIRIGDDEKYAFLKGFQLLKDIPVIMSNDDGLNWKETGTLPTGCTDLQTETSIDSAIYLLCSNGTVFESNDRGVHWNESFPAAIPKFDDFPKELSLKYKR